MLTAEQIEALSDRAAQLIEPVTEFLISDIAQRIAEAGQLTSTASYEVWRAQQLGVSQRQIKKELRKRLKVSHRELRKLLTQAAEVGYNFDIKHLPYVQALPFAENSSIQQIVNAAVQLAEEDLTNITQTMGFVTANGKAVGLSDAYRQSCDYAFTKVSTGAQDYNSAIREAVKSLVDKGVQVIDYDSGVRTSVEAAVRRNIMGGLGLMQEKISQQNHDDLGCDGWEISAHLASAPDHEPIQGKQYTDAEYEKLNSHLVRRIGTLNCGHAAFPVIMGVNDPQYTPEELEKMREDNEKGIDYKGKHYTMYEATQRQRQIERNIRRQKRAILADEATKDDEKLQADQIHYQLLEQEYRRFSKAAGLRLQHERMEMPGFGPKQARAAEKAAEKAATVAEITEPKKKNAHTGIPANAKEPAQAWDSTVGSQSWDKTRRKAMYSAEYGTVNMRYEVARLYDKDGNRLFMKKGDAASVAFTSTEIKQMHNGVLTHNHPGGGCFSPNDINMLRRGRLAEIRAVTPDGVYRLQKPAKWSREIYSLEKIDSMYYDIDNQVSPAIYAKAAHGDITYAQADAMCQEAVLREFANRYAMGFDFDTWDTIRREIK